MYGYLCCIRSSSAPVRDSVWTVPDSYAWSMLFPFSSSPRIPSRTSIREKISSAFSASHEKPSTLTRLPAWIVCTIALSAKSPGAFRCFPEAYLHRFEQRSDTGAQENRLRTRPGIFHKNYEHFVNKADFCRMILYNVSIRQRLLPLFFRVSVSASFSRCTTLYRLWLCFAGIRAVSGCDRLIIFI